MSAKKPAPDLPREDEPPELTPEAEAEIERRAADAEEAMQQGKLIPSEVLFPPRPVVVDEEEEELLARRIDEVPGMDARGELIPMEDFLADVRREIRQRRAG